MFRELARNRAEFLEQSEVPDSAQDSSLWGTIEVTARQRSRYHLGRSLDESICDTSSRLMKKVAQGWSGTPHGTLLGTLLAAVLVAAGCDLATPNPDLQ